MNKFKYFCTLLLFISLSTNKPAHAQSTQEYSITWKKVNREESLRKFFGLYNSVLAEHAETFVQVADKYGFDYRILPAIACVESTCGKFYIQKNNNPFGWGAGRIKFDSFDHAIERVGKGLYEIYISRGLDTIEKIAPVYNPPSPGSWINSANFFISKIEKAF